MAGAAIIIYVAYRCKNNKAHCIEDHDDNEAEILDATQATQDGQNHNGTDNEAQISVNNPSQDGQNHSAPNESTPLCNIL